MNPLDYWQAKHPEYSKKDWIHKPTIFATHAVKYFPPSGRILELGAGQGQDSLYFAKAGYEVVATDFSEFALGQLQNKISPDMSDRLSVQHLDLSQPLTFPRESFDIVYSHLALHYFDQKRTQDLFKEIYAVLKPGGIFATLTNTVEDPEIDRALRIEDEFYETGEITKRYFSTASMAKFTSKYKTLLLDNHGETHKDQIKTLIRFVGRKP